MPFKHTVTDKNGKVHTRTSAERQYLFAVVRHTETDRSAASWSSSLVLARKEAASYAKRDYILSAEIIPCIPVATGRHANK